MCYIQCTCGGQKATQRRWFWPPLGSWSLYEVSRLGGGHLYSLSHLAGMIFTFPLYSSPNAYLSAVYVQIQVLLLIVQEHFLHRCLLQGLMFCVSVNTYKHERPLRCKMNPFPPSLPPCVLWDVWPACRFSFHVLGFFCSSGAVCQGLCLCTAEQALCCAQGADGSNLLSRKPGLAAAA